ncbi:hypothetical protein JTE90_006295 [Oedothorax gibbosus]|uniref:Uncharacterized protein n=1 Tax=Oedothorax gibbosus TaxID=931172 RepID=A0AAV6U336_9ARAC|nr:hypothetical protein JTE90_006295 [Oedothorax gibbosus]
MLHRWITGGPGLALIKEKTSSHTKRARDHSPPPYKRLWATRRVIITPAIYPSLIIIFIKLGLLQFDIQSTRLKSHCVNTDHRPSQCIRNSKEEELEALSERVCLIVASA